MISIIIPPILEESSILYPYSVIDGVDDNNDFPTVVVIGEESARANEAHRSHAEHHHGDDDGGDKPDLNKNDYDEFEVIIILMILMLKSNMMMVITIKLAKIY